MGDVANMIVDGTLCQSCSCPVDDGKASGFPRDCHLCRGFRYDMPGLEKKHQCHCGKKFRTKQGLSDHQRDVHSGGAK